MANTPVLIKRAVVAAANPEFGFLKCPFAHKNPRNHSSTPSNGYLLWAESKVILLRFAIKALFVHATNLAVIRPGKSFNVIILHASS
jgi:hypothetical protein